MFYFIFCIKDLILLSVVSTVTQTSFSISIRVRLGLTAEEQSFLIWSCPFKKR